jgi:multiple sugar transport system permease protein
MTSSLVQEGQRLRTLPRRRSARRRREVIEGYLYLSPWILGFLIFVGGPMIASLFLSFTEYRIIRPPAFIGFTNYLTALQRDRLFWPSLGRTFYYAVVSVPIGIMGSLALSCLTAGSRAQRRFGPSFSYPV